jgi:flagellar assembly protein FliH
VEWKAWSSHQAAGPAPARPTGGGAAAQPAALDTAAVEKQAYERGLRDGEAAGARKSLEQLQGAIQGFAQSAAQLASYKTQLRGEVEKQLVDLSLAVAQKILRRELTIDPKIVLAVVEGCLRELENVEIYRVRANPQDVPALAPYFQQQRRGKVEIVPDAQVGRGGALFETAQGQWDARLETQLAEIAHGLADR